MLKLTVNDELYEFPDAASAARYMHSEHFEDQIELDAALRPEFKKEWMKIEWENLEEEWHRLKGARNEDRGTLEAYLNRAQAPLWRE